MKSYLKPVLGLVCLTGALAGCYPKVCDKAKDPTGCQCPPGVCGDYPQAPPPPPVRTALDAGAK